MAQLESLYLYKSGELQKAGNPPLAAGEKVASAAFFEGGKGATGHGTAGKELSFATHSIP